jgi:histidinol-phosphatase
VTKPYANELAVARRAVERAAALTLQYFRSNLAIEYKADATPVTVADRGAETLLREAVALAFPDDGIFGEEFPEHVGSSGRRWIIDPIDGTASFIRGVPLYGVLLGLELAADDREIDAERCVLGVAAFPAVGETLWAVRGGGAFVNGLPARVSDATALMGATVVTSDCKPELYGDRHAGFERLLSAAARQRGWGDCYGYALVATGRAEVMVDPLLSPWDCAALAPIVDEAGGVFMDWNGRRTIYGGSGIATSRTLADEVLRTLRG